MKIELSKDHVYTVDGAVYPSVTQIISSTIGIGWEVDEWYLMRGTVIHKCFELIAQGKRFDFDPRIKGYIEAAYLFFEQVKPKILELEKKVYSKKFGYAGRMDLLASINDRIFFIDVKSSINMPALCLQLAAYSLAYNEQHKTNYRYGLGLQLKENGKYNLTERIDLKKHQRNWQTIRSYHRLTNERI